MTKGLEILLLVALGTTLGCGNSSGHPGVRIDDCGQFVSEEGEVAAVFPMVEPDCVAYSGQLVRIPDGTVVLQSEICNSCPTKMALRTKEELTLDQDQRMNAADYYYRPVGVMQVEMASGALLAGCPEVYTAIERHLVSVEAVIPAGKAMYQTHDVSFHPIPAGSFWPDSSDDPVKVTQVWPPATRPRGGDALSVSAGCQHSFDERPVQGVAVSADVTPAVGATWLDQ